MAEGPNLVLGTAWNLGIADVRIFVESLRRHYHGDVMLLVTSRGSADLVSYLRSRDIVPVFFDCSFWMVMHVQLGRYVRYEETLRGVDKEYAHVLLTDVSDVVFQADPFAQLPEGELLCFMEVPGRTIGQCADNTRWVQQIYGPAVWENMKNHEISCSGTTIGSQRAILQYIDLMLHYANPNLLAPLMQFRGHDQGIHNYLLRTGALPNARLIPNGQHVYTVQTVPDSEITLGPGGTILAPGGRLCPIVHQYPSKPAVLKHIRSAYDAISS
jgi:hypothetical protein